MYEETEAEKRLSISARWHSKRYFQSAIKEKKDKGSGIAAQYSSLNIIGNLWGNLKHVMHAGRQKYIFIHLEERTLGKSSKSKKLEVILERTTIKC